MLAPTYLYWKVVKRILRDLRGTIKVRLLSPIYDFNSMCTLMQIGGGDITDKVS